MGRRKVERSCYERGQMLLLIVVSRSAVITVCVVMFVVLIDAHYTNGSGNYYYGNNYIYIMLMAIVDKTASIYFHVCCNILDNGTYSITRSTFV